MNISSRLFFVFMLTLLFGAVVLSYYRFYHLRDYDIAAEVGCDPVTESCFVRECKEDCEGVLPVEFYKIATKRASLMPTCDPHMDESCDPFACEAASENPFGGGCSYLYCNADNVPEGERCSISDDESLVDEEGVSRVFKERGDPMAAEEELIDGLTKEREGFDESSEKEADQGEAVEE